MQQDRRRGGTGKKRGKRERGEREREEKKLFLISCLSPFTPTTPTTTSLFPSPPPKLLVEPLRVIPHPIRQLRTRQNALHPVDGDAIDEQQQRRQRADAEPRRERRVRVGVDFDDFHGALHAVGAGGDVLGHDLAGAAPRRVEVDEHGDGRLFFVVVVKFVLEKREGEFFFCFFYHRCRRPRSSR